MKRYLSLLISVILVLSLFTACGSSSYENAGAEEAPMEGMNMDAAANGELSSSSSAPESKLPDNRKWVITSEILAETNDLDQTLDAVLTVVSELQGYVEDQHFDNGSYYSGYDSDRSVQMTVRIPAEQIDSFVASVEEHTNVVSSSRNLQDITLQYSDTETRVAALKAEEARLLEFMEQAETMADLLEIERRLTDVHYELENVTSRLRTYDNQVNYATIRLNINEVKEYTPVEEPSVPERITAGFAASLKGVWKGMVNFFVGIIVASPYLVVWAVIILIVFFLVRLCTRKKKAKKQVPQASADVKPIPEEWTKFESASKEKKDEKK